MTHIILLSMSNSRITKQDALNNTFKGIRCRKNAHPFTNLHRGVHLYIRYNLKF